MRYRCLIIDEEERLDATLRELFAGFATAASTPLDPGCTTCAPAPEGVSRRAIKRAPWRAAPSPATRMC